MRQYLIPDEFAYLIFEELLRRYEKMLEKMKMKLKPVIAAASVAALSAPVAVFAEGGGGTSAAMETAMNGVKTEFLGTVAKVAPIAISIAAAPLIWKLGINFFKRITGGN